MMLGVIVGYRFHVISIVHFDMATTLTPLSKVLRVSVVSTSTMLAHY